MGIRVLSLFDGIRCGMVALERAGISVSDYLASEIDKNSIHIADKNYPNCINLGDVNQIDFLALGKIDLLIAGSPCQDLSITKNNREGLQGSKSGLFYKFVEALEKTKPKYFLLENVASMKKESKDIITKILGVEPIFIDSNCFSAQDRPRLYWTNIPVDVSTLRECNLCLDDIMEPEVAEKYFYSHPLTNIDMSKKICATMQYKNNEMHKRIFNPKFKVHTLTTCGGGNTQKKVMDKGRARKLTPLEYERLQTLPDGYTCGVADTHRYTGLGNGWTVDVITHILKGAKFDGNALDMADVQEIKELLELTPEKTVEITNALLGELENPSLAIVVGGKDVKYNFESERCDYLTPPALVQRILGKINQSQFYIDACCTLHNIPAMKHFTEGTVDGLKESWQYRVLYENYCDWVYFNPPYSECAKWVKKAFEEQQRGNRSVALIPVRTETDYWHKYILFNKDVEIDWLKKGWKFLHPETGEEMGVFKNALAIVYFNRKGEELL